MQAPAADARAGRDNCELRQGAAGGGSGNASGRSGCTVGSQPAAAASRRAIRSASVGCVDSSVGVRDAPGRAAGQAGSSQQ